MARSTYGASLADYSVDSSGRPVAGAVFDVWTGQAGGVQLTDLLDADKTTPVTQAIADDRGFIQFDGPDGVTGDLWLADLDGNRKVIRPTDVGDRLALAEDALADLTNPVTAPYLIKQSDVYRLDRAAVGTVDDTATLTSFTAAAVADGVSKLLLPPGTINVKTAAGLTLGPQSGGTAIRAGGIDIAGYGEDTVINYTSTTNGGAGCFNIAGTESATTAMTADALAGAQVITVPSSVASSLVVGSWLCLESDTPAFPSSTLAGLVPIRAKEMRQVIAKSGTSITLDGPLIWDYPVALNTVVTTVTMVRGVRLRDMAFTSGDDSATMKQYAARIRYATGVEIENITVRRGPGGIHLYYVADSALRDVTIDGLPSQLDAWGYGVVVAGPSAHINIDGLKGRNMRHLFTTAQVSTTVTGGLGFGGGPRHITITNGHGEGSQNGFAVWDTHHPGYDITFDNCRATGGSGASSNGFQTRSIKTRFLNCSSVRSGSYALRVDQFADDTEIIGGEYAYVASVAGMALQGKARVKGAEIHHNVGPGVLIGSSATEVQIADCSIHDNTYGVSDQSAGVGAHMVGPGNVIPKSATQTISLLNLTASVVAVGNTMLGYGAGVDGSSGSTAALRSGNVVSGGGLVAAGDSFDTPLYHGGVGNGTADDTAALTATIAAARVGGVLDLGGRNWKITSPVTLSKRLTVQNGSITAGTHSTLVVTAADAVLRNLSLTRSTNAASTADTIAQRSNVVVNAPRVKILDCDMSEGNAACVYITNGAGNGTLIQGGRYTNSGTAQAASLVYGAAGVLPNLDITVRGITASGTCAFGIQIFDSSRCTIEDNDVSGMTRMPTATLTGWTVTTGTTYVNNGRADGSANVVYNNGVNVPRDVVTPTAPAAGMFGVGGDGKVYLNLSGVDPNTRTITADIVSGYGIMFYATTTGTEPMCDNAVLDNRVHDVDGFGIYMQLSGTAGLDSTNNRTSGNRLRDVCREGSQLASLPFAGIGWNGGTKSVMEGDSVDGAGTAGGKEAPGVYVMLGGFSGTATGRSTGVSVRNATKDGFTVGSASWQLIGCHSDNNTLNGFSVTAPVGLTYEGIDLIGCEASGNGLSGVSLDAGASGSLVRGAIIGGDYSHNSGRGIRIAGTRDTRVIGAAAKLNGLQQILVTGTASRTTVSDCHMAGSSSLGLVVDSTGTDNVVGAMSYAGTFSTALSVTTYPVRVGGTSGFGATFIGTGSPESVVTGKVGDEFRRLDGGAGTTLYVKESGAGTTTGWIAK